MKKPYRVHVGYTSTGRDSWRYFESLEAATKFVSNVFTKKGLVLSITGRTGRRTFSSCQNA